MNAELAGWEAKVKEYEHLRVRLSTLHESLSHEIMSKVPIGNIARTPGKLVHTNKVTVLLGDNWFADLSTTQALGLVDRRLQYIRAQQMGEVEKRLGSTSKTDERLAQLKQTLLVRPAETGMWEGGRDLEATDSPTAELVEEVAAADVAGLGEKKGRRRLAPKAAEASAAHLRDRARKAGRAAAAVLSEEEGEEKPPTTQSGDSGASCPSSSPELQGEKHVHWGKNEKTSLPLKRLRKISEKRRARATSENSTTSECSVGSPPGSDKPSGILKNASEASPVDLAALSLDEPRPPPPIPMPASIMADVVVERSMADPPVREKPPVSANVPMSKFRRERVKEH